MHIDRTTAAERVTIQNVTGGMIADIDSVLILLDALWEHNFSSSEQETIHEHEAEVIGRTLRLCTDKIFDTLLKYSLTVGDYGFRGVSVHMESMKRAADVIAIEKAVSTIINKERHMDNEEKEASIKARIHIEELPDEQASLLLKAMLKEI